MCVCVSTATSGARRVRSSERRTLAVGVRFLARIPSMDEPAKQPNRPKRPKRPKRPNSQQSRPSEWHANATK